MLQPENGLTDLNESNDGGFKELLGMFPTQNKQLNKYINVGLYMDGYKGTRCEMATANLRCCLSLHRGQDLPEILFC